MKSMDVDDEETLFANEEFVNDEFPICSICLQSQGENLLQTVLD